MNDRLVLALVMLFAPACTSTEISSGPRDPANPDAERAPLPDIGATFAPEFDPLAAREPAGPAAHHDHGNVPAPGEPRSDTHGSEQATVHYTCPMHPQVVEDQPGKCPICGMKLVPVRPKPPANTGTEKK